MTRTSDHWFNLMRECAANGHQLSLHYQYLEQKYEEAIENERNQNETHHD